MKICLQPPPIHGIHKRIFANAAYLRDRGATFTSALGVLTGWRDSYTFRRPVFNTEIHDAVNAAYKRPRQAYQSPHTRRNSGGYAVKPTWPKANPEKRAELIDRDFGLYDLWESSPRRFDDSETHTGEILETLFPGDPLLCCGWSMKRFETKPLSEWEDLEGMQFLTPSPMSAKYGTRKSDGGQSAHTLSNTGPRRFLVIDYDDHAGADIHASTSMYLAQRYPLALGLHSGGKSLHAWYYVAGQPEEELRRFMAHAGELGGDPALWTRSQFCRMPDGTRDNGTRQTVYYFNPEVCA